ncbi:glycosyltransferase [Oryzomonas rubra]|uniref:Glycosyltransferase n=1 Tax=Oryzomonas rubra TaxID=2509454 RepID=A0A5A9XE49_9BACT|nr:glycosyltransferase [Oryzomonas rubra]KAA0891236.1 glycosyltransferase [Oryzomonas rubra]
MKLACISYFLPGKENNHGPNSLIYQIIAHRCRNISIDLYLPQEILDKADGERIATIEQDLAVKIHPLCGEQPSLFQRLLSSWWPSGARLHYRIDDLLNHDYDLVWGYPFWTAPYVNRVPARKVISGMDCATLLYIRKVKACVTDRPLQIFRYSLALVMAFLFESIFLRHIKVHVVGRSDQITLKMLGVDSFYVPHPTNPIAMSDHETVRIRSARTVRILVANSLDVFYGSDTVLKWLKALFAIAPRFPGTEFEIVFHKGNAELIKKYLAREKIPNQFKMTFVGWIDNYEEFLLAIDIQIFPLDIGVGTKTSVLTALYMNVICIGTSVACENIETQSAPQHLLRADSPDEFVRQFMEAMTCLQDHTCYPLGYALSPMHSPTSSAANFWERSLS